MWGLGASRRKAQFRVTVLGAGKTGLAVARFFASQGARVFLSDRSSLSLACKRELARLGVEHEEGGHSERALRADLIVPSPGIPYDAPILKEARLQGVPVIGEIELAYRLCPSSKIVAVTGTVGKTTTTHLIAELLRAEGHPVVLAGNGGEPFIAQLPRIRPETVVVLEVSSYQLEHVETFRPHVGVFTRFAPHHIERHGSLERYFAIKCRLFEHQREGDSAVVQHEIPLPDVPSRVVPFRAEDLEAESFGHSLSLTLPPHLREDLAGALAAARLFDPTLTPSGGVVTRALRLPHRLEFVAEVHGVKFYNDSKATSFAATVAALDAFSHPRHRPLALLLGGQDEGLDPEPLARAVVEHDVEQVYLLGETQGRWAEALSRRGYSRLCLVGSIEDALAEVCVERPRPRTCLFSPGAPSFDQFSNYEERGERFRRAVRALAGARPRRPRPRRRTPITPRSDQPVVRP